MKIVSKNTLLACMLAAVSCGAFATDSVDLKIIGTIVPPSCTPTLSGGGIVDYGEIPASSITGSTTPLTTKSISLTVTCDAPARVAIATADNRSGTAGTSAVATLGSGSAQSFGLGTVDGKMVGAYLIDFWGGNADGHATDNIHSSDNGATWNTTSRSSAVYAKPGARIHSWGTEGTGTPAAFTTMAESLTIRTVLNKLSEMPSLKQEVPLDGLATFSLVYL